MGLDTTGFDLALALNGGVFMRESIPARAAAMSDQAAALTTQVMTSVAVPLFAGDVITNIAFRSGATAAGTPTNWWFALYDNSATPALIAQSADQTSGAWAANTTKTLAITLPAAGFAVPFKVQTSGIYYAAIMVKATTVPSLVSQTLFDTTIGGTGLVSGQKALAWTSGSSLTATAPSTIATPTGSASRPYAVLS